MGWTYSGPQSGNKDVVRYLVQDTSEHEPLITDEEILWVLRQFPNVRRAAAEVAGQIAMQFAKRPDIRDGDTAVSYSQRAKQYAELAAKLKRESTLLGAQPYAGGIDIGDKQTTEGDRSRVRPAFTRELFDLQAEPSRTDTWEEGP